MLVTLSGTVSSVTPEQPSKAYSSIVVSEAGRLNSLMLLHSSNAEFPIVLRELGSCIAVSPVQLLNAYLPMDVTLFGKAAEVIDLHPANA